MTRGTSSAILAIIVVVASLTLDGFGSPDTGQPPHAARSASALGILAAGMAIVVIARGLDLRGPQGQRVLRDDVDRAEHLHRAQSGRPSTGAPGQPGRRQELVTSFIERFRIRAIGARAKVMELSGGDQQKVVLAKSLNPRSAAGDVRRAGPRVDVGSIEEIHMLIREYADSGAAVVLISSYRPEIFALSDRILVARAGRVVAEFDPEAATEEDVMFAAVH